MLLSHFRFCAVSKNPWYVSNVHNFKYYSVVDTTSPKRSSVNDKLESFAKLIRLDKPAAILNVAAPALWTQALLTPFGSLPDPVLLSKILLAAFFVRSGQCALNDVIDADIDGKVERTKTRPIPARKISKLEGLSVAAVLLSGSLGVLLSLPTQSWIYGFIGGATLFMYPYTKKFLKWPGLFLGMANGLGVPISASAMGMPVTALAPVCIYSAYILYNIGYEMMYSFQDIKHDKSLSLFSSAQVFSDEKVKIAVAVMFSLSSAFMLLAGYFSTMTFPYYISVGAASAIYSSHIAKFNLKDSKTIASVFGKCYYVPIVVFLGGVLGKLC